jgi:small subunit ribosomal protein S8
LKKEGFIKNFNVDKENFPPKLTIELKYYEKNKSAIEGIERISKPGRRVYSGVEEIPKVLNGLGVSILSTSKGLLTGKECERNNVGGEVMLYVW